MCRSDAGEDEEAPVSPASLPSLLAHVEEFVAQSESYPLTEPVPKIPVRRSPPLNEQGVRVAEVRHERHGQLAQQSVCCSPWRHSAAAKPMSL